MKNETDELRPLYEHDCSSCIYLGRNTYQLLAKMEQRAADVYFCQGTKNHIGEKACISVRWQQGPQGFSSFPYFVFYLLRYDSETDGNDTLLKPYLWGLEQAKQRGLVLPHKEA